MLFCIFQHLYNKHVTNFIIRYIKWNKKIPSTGYFQRNGTVCLGVLQNFFTLGCQGPHTSLPLYAPGPSPRVLGLPHYGGQASTWPPESILALIWQTFLNRLPGLSPLSSISSFLLGLSAYILERPNFKNSGASLSDLKNYSLCSVTNIYTGFL